MAHPVTIEDKRRLYAAAVTRSAGVKDPRIEEVFAKVPREELLPPAPWTLIENGVAVETTDDPLRLYQNVLVSLDKAKGINNGEPALHAAWLKAVDPQPGETAIHVGAGSGYYTAMLAHLVAPGGRVEAYEIHPGLAAEAAGHLAAYSNVTVHPGSALGRELPAADLIYVNAGIAAPDPHWLRALKPGGRIILPWQSLSNWGHTLRIVRRDRGFEARAGMGVGFINCKDQANLVRGSRLSDADVARTRSVWLTADRPPDDSATAVFPAVWFSSEEVS